MTTREKVGLTVAWLSGLLAFAAVMLALYKMDY